MSIRKTSGIAIGLMGCAALSGAAAQDTGVPVPPVSGDGTIVTPSFNLPFSSFASPEATAAFVRRLRAPMPVVRSIEETRRNSDNKLRPQLELIRKLYPVTSTRGKVGSVPIETFVPAAGIAPENQDKVLMELHGGGFVAGGGGLTGALSSIPIAVTGKIKVVSVDYRLAPENRFPAASEDVETVYRELLKTYKPENIGIFGCSAGGMLSAEAIPWLLKQKLPLPGAIGVFCASTHTFAEGDSAQLWPRMGSVLRILPPPKPDGTFGRTSPYFAGVSPSDPLAVPAASQDVLKAFPPTLFLTGTRAPEMSGAAQGHLELVDLGRKSELLLFDGMDHGFFSDATLPESRRAYRLIVQFFADNLGHSPQP
jgi:acetyl esterase/lipase